MASLNGRANSIEQYSEADRPYRALRTWAREEGQGLYNAARRENPTLRNRRAFLHYAEHKESCLGHGLSGREIERLAGRFYSPAHIAELSEISEYVWRSYEETYEIAGGVRLREVHKTHSDLSGLSNDGRREAAA